MYTIICSGLNYFWLLEFFFVFVNIRTRFVFEFVTDRRLYAKIFEVILPKAGSKFKN